MSVKFLGEDNGLVEMRIRPDDELKIRTSPEEGFTKELICSRGVTKDLQRYDSYDKNRCFCFRIRTRKNDKGEIVEAHYGKIYGDWNFVGPGGMSMSQFVSALIESALNRQGFDVPFCEVLFAAGELKALHSYAVARYGEIYDVRFCTGMIPLSKKLFKAGDPLAACIFMRGAIYYLMGTGNSRYYNDVHAHRRTLAEMAASVKDWETVEPQGPFDFAADFASRRSFWF